MKNYYIGLILGFIGGAIIGLMEFSWISLFCGLGIYLIGYGKFNDEFTKKSTRLHKNVSNDFLYDPYFNNRINS
jgi:hypothetical protein